MAITCKRHKFRAALDTSGSCVACSRGSNSRSAGVLNSARTVQLGMLSGAAAGLTADLLIFPLDTLKTRLQSGGGSIRGALLFRSLYNGFAPAIMASAPCAAAFFGTYDYVKSAIRQKLLNTDKRWTPLQHTASAALGNVAASTIRVPFEVVKQRVQTGLYKSSSAAIRSIWSKDGVRGFLVGYQSLLLRELPCDAIQYPVYEFLKFKWSERTNSQKLETWQTSVCGSVAGGVAAAFTTPFDVVKTRIMNQGTTIMGTRGQSQLYKGIVHGFVRIAKEEGPGALFSGLVPRVVWVSIGSAIFFGSYEATRRHFFPHFEMMTTKDQLLDRPSLHRHSGAVTSRKL